MSVSTEIEMLSTNSASDSYIFLGSTLSLQFAYSNVMLLNGSVVKVTVHTSNHLAALVANESFASRAHPLKIHFVHILHRRDETLQIMIDTIVDRHKPKLPPEVNFCQSLCRVCSLSLSPIFLCMSPLVLLTAFSLPINIYWLCNVIVDWFDNRSVKKCTSKWTNSKDTKNFF